MRRSSSLLIAAVLLALPVTASAATLHANPSTFASMYSSAAGGDTILLASGSYGSWNGGAKASMITIDEESGASASFSGGNFASSVRNLTIRNVTYTGPVEVDPPSGVKMNLIFDADTWGNVGQGSREGRLSIVNGGVNAIDGNGVQIKNSTFGPGGCSDGIQDLSRGTEIGPGNEFKGIVQGSCSQHADAIQPYASNYTHIHDNYMHDNEQGIMSPDGPATGYLFENNVIQTTNAYPCITVGYGQNGTIRHNVCVNGNIRVYGGNQNTNSSGMKVQDNSPGVNVTACSGCIVDHNQQVTYTGGTGRCAYATASPKGTASDGTDIGLNDCGSSPPPPPADADGDGVPDPADLCPGTPAGTQVDANGCPFQQPPTDHQPLARFTASPEPSSPQQTVTFDATATTCDDTPCTYHWHDIDSSGTGDWPLGPDGATMTFAFQGTGTKYVELVVTDADGDVSRVLHNHVVQASAPPPDNTPVARFTASPEPSARQQTTTFDASSSTCADTPCRYHWHDVDSSGTGDWPLGPDGAVMTFAFQGLGTKYVELVLTDADGDVSRVRHNHVVR